MVSGNSKTQCINGHTYDQDNSYVPPNGRRRCRQCNRDQKKQYDDRQRAKLRKSLMIVGAIVFFLLRVANGQNITIGETNVLSNGPDGGNANLLLAQAATLSQPATLLSFSFYVRAAAGNLILGLYDSTGLNGGPGNMIASTSSLPVTTTGWLIGTPTANPVLAPGMYWLAYLPSDNNLGFFADGTGQSAYYPFTFGQMPSTFSSSPVTLAAHWSFYATLSPGPTPTPAPTPTPTPTPVTTPTPGQVTLAWDPPSTITGYNLFYGTVSGGPYPNMINVGLVYRYTVIGLVSGTKYYSTIESYDVNGHLSCPNPEVSFVAP